MEIKGTEYHKSLYDNLNDIIEMNDSTACCVDDIVMDFSISNIQFLLTVLIDNKKQLEHELNSLKGLWATDKPELVEDKQNVLFQIK